MKEFKYLHRKPTNIISNGSKKDYKRPVSPIFVLEGYSIVAAITNGALTGAGKIIEGGEAEVTIVPNEGYVLPSSISVVGASNEYDDSTGVVSLSNPTGDVTVSAECPVDVDPVLANNSWETIRAVCEAGDAANYWAVGDTKNVTGGDNSVRPVAIVDMSGLYGKHVVFQFMKLTEDAYVWDADNINDYSASDMVGLLAPSGNAYVALVDSDLSAQLTDTTVKVAKGGNDSTLVDVAQKLFLPAEKEISASASQAVSAESSALTTFAYWVAHSSADDRKMYKPSDSSNASSWWLRSPYSGNTRGVCVVNYDGNLGYNGASNSFRVAPCFAF